MKGTISILLCITAMHVGHAQNDTIHQHESRLDTIQKHIKKEVQIKAKKSAESKKMAGTEIIDKCELGKLACCNLAESFENSNTVDVNYADGITGSREIQMLGLAGSYSQQLMEGTAYHRGILGKIGLELVPGPWIESIGINKGIGSVVNGYDNISGQINIEFMKPKKSLDWFLNGYVSEIGKSDLNLVKGWKLKDNLYTSTLAHTSFSFMTMDNNQDGFTDMPKFLNLNLMNKWQWFADNGFVLNATLQATHHESNAGQIGHDGYIHNHQPYILLQKTESIQALVKTGWELDAVKESSFAVLFRINLANQNGNIDTRLIDNTQRYFSITPIYQTNLGTSHHVLKIGGQFLYNQESETLGSLGFSKKEWVNGLFGELSIKSETITTILGLRGDIHQKLGAFISPRAQFIFQPSAQHSFKLTGGFGFKTPTYLSESFGYLVSNRDVILPTDLEAEKAWNMGIAYKLNYDFLGLASTLDISYFLTLFQNQLVQNVEKPEIIKLEYLKDESRAQNIQIENTLTFNSNWSLKLSYKNDLTTAIFNGEKKTIPLLKTDKFLANLAWNATNGKWRISSTLLVNGRARLPQMSTFSETYSPVYPIVHAQINYIPNRNMDFYFGSENIFSYTQYQRIQSFEDTDAKSFDAGMIWGPMDVRRVYLGAKMNF